MGVTAQFLVGYTRTPRRRLKRHYATIAAIVSAAGSAIGSAAAGSAATGAAAGLGSAAAGAGAGALGGAAAGAGAGALGSGLSVAGGSTLAAALPELAGAAAPAIASGVAPGAASIGAGVPSLAAGMGELGAGLPSMVSTGAGPTSALTGGGGGGFSEMLQGGLNVMNNPGGSLGGEVGKLFGNEKLGSQIGQAGQMVMKGNEKPQQSGVPMPAQALSIAAPQAPPLPGMGSAMGGSGPSFHINPQTGILEYS